MVYITWEALKMDSSGIPARIYISLFFCFLNSLTPVIILQSSFKALHGKSMDTSQWEY